MAIDEEFRNLEERVKNLEEMILSKKRVPKYSKRSIIDLLLELKEQGFLDQPRTPKQIIEKLAENGNHYPYESLTAPLQKTIRKGLLGRLKNSEDNWVYVKR